MYYQDRLRELIIPTHEHPMPGGGNGRRRCDGYQWPCNHDPDNYPPAPIVPTDCPPGYQVSVTQMARYTYGNEIDCGSITVQTACPSIQEGSVAVTPEYEFDCGRL